MACAVSDQVNACLKGSSLTVYYNVGTPTTAVWVEHLGMIEDLDVSEVEELQEFSSRSSQRMFKEYNYGEVELAVTGTQMYDPSYEGWQYMNAARAGGNPGDFLILGGYLNLVCSYGWRGAFWNSDRSLRGPAQGNMVNAVNLQPASGCNRGDTPGVHVVRVETAGAIVVHPPNVWEEFTRP
jgi:hypothetical protein